MKRYIPLLLGAGILLAACGNGNGGATTAPQPPAVPQSPAVPAPAVSTLSLAAQAGQKIFFDQSLSGSGKMSCASCHSPDFAYGPPNNLAVQLGGAGLDVQGQRAVPSLRYTQYTPAYADLLDNPDGISVPGPGGGLTWDGRAATLAEQASIPLLAANEMANASAQQVVDKVRLAAYARCCGRPSATMRWTPPMRRSPMCWRPSRPSSWKTPASTPTAASSTCTPATRSAAP